MDAIKKYCGYVGCALLIVGCVLPYVKVLGVSASYAEGDGAIVIICAIVAIILMALKKEKISVSASGVALGIFAYDAINGISTLGLKYYAIGFYVIIAGFAVLIAYYAISGVFKKNNAQVAAVAQPVADPFAAQPMATPVAPVDPMAAPAQPVADPMMAQAAQPVTPQPMDPMMQPQQPMVQPDQTNTDQTNNM